MFSYTINLYIVIKSFGIFSLTSDKGVLKRVDVSAVL